MDSSICQLLAANRVRENRVIVGMKRKLKIVKIADACTYIHDIIARIINSSLCKVDISCIYICRSADFYLSSIL